MAGGVLAGHRRVLRVEGLEADGQGQAGQGLGDAVVGGVGGDHAADQGPASLLVVAELGVGQADGGGRRLAVEVGGRGALGDRCRP